MLIRPVLITTKAEFKQALFLEINNKLESVFNAQFPEFQKRIKDIIRTQLTSSEEWHSILDGELRIELGLRHPEEALDDILQTILDGIIFKNQVKLLTHKISAVMSGEAIPSDYYDLTNLSSAFYISFGRNGATPIYWLSYLLQSGTANIFINTSIMYLRRYSSASRSGYALMRKHNGATYNIPAEFGGTPGNNFITRAFIDSRPLFEDVVKNVILSHL